MKMQWKLTDKIILVTLALMFAFSAIGQIWLRLNWDNFISMIQMVHP